MQEMVQVVECWHTVTLARLMGLGVLALIEIFEMLCLACIGMGWGVSGMRERV